jgi:hypothetical protein
MPRRRATNSATETTAATALAGDLLAAIQDGLYDGTADEVGQAKIGI